MAKKVTVYTTNTCASCVMLKKWLTAKGQEFSLVNLDERPDERQKVIDMTGAMTVPITLVTDGDDTTAAPQFVVGWKPGQIAAALGA